MSTPVYNVYFVAGNVDPTPPRPPKAPAKPAVRLALTPHAPPATPVAAPAAIPRNDLRTSSTVSSPTCGAGWKQMMTNRKDAQHQVAPDPEQDVVIEHPIHRHDHRDHHSPRSTSRSERGRSVRTAGSSFSQALRPPPGQWDIHTGLWDPVCWKHSSQSACSSSQSSCSSSLETVFSLPSIRSLRTSRNDTNQSASHSEPGKYSILVKKIIKMMTTR